MDMVKTKPKVWVPDSNIIVYWIMGRHILRWLIVDYYKFSEELVSTYLKRYEDSINFVDEILKQEKDSNKFYMVDLTLNEVFSGIKDEIKSVMLFEKGYPLSRWSDRRLIGELKLDEEFIIKIRDFIAHAFHELMKKIEILPVPYEDKGYFDVYASLTLKNIAMQTQDAILLTTAILEKADYFVTKDDYSVGRYKGVIKDKYDLEIICPEHGLNVLKRKVK
ncbi:MAG: hypothetical protein CVT89_05845 [Candidatus Altiarchaeales archaeon HGW-Altiarchaeales-2]|nr:MAG: hypothetical protein CVT89_05845 [Candidatus Altiarchaeales archaeon HGW-Altiarchaeales-2]